MDLDCVSDSFEGDVDYEEVRGTRSTAKVIEHVMPRVDAEKYQVDIPNMIPITSVIVGMYVYHFVCHLFKFYDVFRCRKSELAWRY